MTRDVVTITASLIIRRINSRMVGYVVTMSDAPCEIASLSLGVDSGTETWREDFRLLCQHLVDESFAEQGFRVNWVMPRVPAHA